ncbi:gamma-glutamylcyclotransferase [Lacihabitans sp. LS3-19]|uniref:gamma-glutamylcyclotransferase family protein n=1 Tax=Lacihabitans sp. LS3-19 TaxID=2487335 RepID=UPI0020CE5031|nr:gamma-glutamylcyclotransferase family protein [Lacihabitans sp. LS3-19]MCP9769795.1 gamma-glutamylcyclotransferase [Lacihabitans sp. LS3-19]
MEEIYLFVYGTLMRKFPENPFKNELEKNLTFMGEAYTYGKLFLVDYYPGFIPDLSDEKSKVWGEVFRVKTPEIVFELLDEYEEYFPNDKYKSLYTRELWDCFLMDSNKRLNCNIYFYNKPIHKLKYLINGQFINK